MHRPWYYTHVFADPSHGETVYVANLALWKSTDGGASFTEIQTPHGDNHDLWIDPADPNQMIEGNDGGACVSCNGGQTWSSIYNQPTAQFYRIDTDNQYPYRVYATQQDNTTISTPSAAVWGAGALQRYDHRTGQIQLVNVWPEASAKRRSEMSGEAVSHVPGCDAERTRA
jgi:hypothetical protein